MSEIENYLRENLVDVHQTMISSGVPASIISNADSLSLSLVELFLSPLDSEKLADLHDTQFEILKRNISIKIAKVVIFACDKAIN